MILDATDLIVGRFATVVAKKALMGEEVAVVNSELAVVSGSRTNVLDSYKTKRARGAPLLGPYFPRRPDMVVRRMIRGMLPHKQPKGKAAFGRVMCYIGVPSQFAGKKLETVKEAQVSKLPNLKYIRIGEICKQLGSR
jgi:large subunit ribosomal protein L13